MAPLAPRLGSMREALALQSNALVTSTGTGFKTESWSTYAHVAGEYVEPAQGRESWMQGAVVATVGPAFRIRYRADVRPKHRVVWKGQTLQIEAVIPRTRVGDRFLILQCGLQQ
jgi:SPP1 family predicted phage head-tail adaptor